MDISALKIFNSLSFVIHCFLLPKSEAQVTDGPGKVDLFGGSSDDLYDYPDPTELPITIETVVWYPLRIWHIAAIVATLITIVIVVLCCCNDCRIPRTKEQIEADKEKKKMTTKYTQEMNELCFGTAGTRMVVPPMDPNRTKASQQPGTNRKLYLPK